MKLNAGEKAPEVVNAYIEIPQGSMIKYELDKDMDVIAVDRFAFTSMGYPANYGFIPATHAEDGDPMDILVLTIQPVHPGVVVPAVPIGLLEMEDEAGVDTKIIAVPPMKVDPFMGIYKDISDVPEAITARIKHFFERYKELEKGKWVKIRNWRPKSDALEAITKSLKTK